jgi:hypothetical protein
VDKFYPNCLLGFIEVALVKRFLTEILEFIGLLTKQLVEIQLFFCSCQAGVDDYITRIITSIVNAAATVVGNCFT